VAVSEVTKSVPVITMVVSEPLLREVIVGLLSDGLYYWSANYHFP
jgi:hypothetical protein